CVRSPHCSSSRRAGWSIRSSAPCGANSSKRSCCNTRRRPRKTAARAHVSTPAALQFPHSRVLLARTRLAYVHLLNLLTDAKRDRSARISGYVAVSQLDELLLFYLLNGEVANASVRDPRGSRAIAIASALEKVPHEPEYGECCFHEAAPEELACIFASRTTPCDPWPAGMIASDATVLFPRLAATAFDGFIHIVANNHVTYLVI